MGKREQDWRAGVGNRAGRGWGFRGVHEREEDGTGDRELRSKENMDL